MGGKGQKGSFRASKAPKRKTSKQHSLGLKKNLAARKEQLAKDAKVLKQSSLPIDAGNVTKEQQQRRLIREREATSDVAYAPTPAAAGLLAALRAETKAPSKETQKAPAKETQKAPANGTKAPANETRKAPARAAKAPANEIKPSVKAAKAPAEDAVAGSKRARS